MQGKRTSIVAGLVAAALFMSFPSFAPAVLAESYVRVIHGSPDAPDVDILLDGDVLLTDVPYLAASDYLTVPAGTHNVQVRAAGTDTIALDFDLTLAPDTDYTAIVTDFLDDLNPFALLDDRAPPREGMTEPGSCWQAGIRIRSQIRLEAPGR